MPDPEITPDVIEEHGITPEEYQRILEVLGREPNFTELGIFSVMWSEHCSYKNTRPLLKTFPTQSPKVIVAAGEENAGVIDMGDGLGVAFQRCLNDSSREGGGYNMAWASMTIA